ncbi:hypothetical protein PMAYCL1PPCAC_18459, partial [Pristionchus mayeri]
SLHQSTVSLIVLPLLKNVWISSARLPAAGLPSATRISTGRRSSTKRHVRPSATPSRSGRRLPSSSPRGGRRSQMLSMGSHLLLLL